MPRPGRCWSITPPRRPRWRKELAEAAAEFGVGFVDAPVSGGQAGAENGQLTIMCGADDEAFYELAKPVMAAYAKASALMGAAGAGQLTKMVNQILIAGIVQGLAEGLNFAVKAGLDPEQVTEVIKYGAAQSWQLENRGRTMVRDEFDFGFAVEWMRKDLGIVLDEAHRNGARLPVTALIDQFYAQVIARGGKPLGHQQPHPPARQRLNDAASLATMAVCGLLLAACNDAKSSSGSTRRHICRPSSRPQPRSAPSTTRSSAAMSPRSTRATSPPPIRCGARRARYPTMCCRSSRPKWRR